MDSPIQRQHYASVLEDCVETPQIKVLTGVRRCGKSTILKMFHSFLQTNYPQENCLLLRCDSTDVPLNPTAEWLEKTVIDALDSADSSKPLFILLDEVQEVPGWEKVVRRLHAHGGTDIYVTGSNAFLLSSELATYLSGRYIEIPVFPLSFNEYKRFASRFDKQRESVDALFGDYLRYGGMPGLFALRKFDEESILGELQAIHDTVILNDVARRFDIRDIELLEKLVRYVFSTSGNLFSTRSIVNALQGAGRKVYPATIESYLDGLERAFLVYPCEQSGLQGRKILRPLRKFYAPDTGLRNLEIGFELRDIGYQLESAVRMELARRGYQVSVGALPNSEIDFIAQKGPEKLYLQVSQSVSEPSVLEREITPLRAVHDGHPKAILTLDRIGVGTTEDGIKVLNLIDWLLGE